MLNVLQHHLLLPQFVVAGLETTLNALIKRSPHVFPILRKLSGKCLQINLTSPNVTLFAVFSEQQIDWLSNYEGEVDCRVNLAASALPKLADKRHLSELINNQTLVLNGDLQILQHFATLLETLEHDPAELLSPFVGDVVAQASTNFVQQLIGKVKGQFQHNAESMVENLMTERPVLVHRLQVADFCEQVQELAKQAEQLEQKMAKLIK